MNKQNAKTFTIRDGDTLVFSVNQGPWETVIFKAADFKNIGTATVEELAAVLNRSGSLNAHADENGQLVLATVAKGEHSSLEVDLARSTGAAALGISGGQARTQGTGLRPARLISRIAVPQGQHYNIPPEAEMNLVVDKSRARMAFDKLASPQATVPQVVDYLNRRTKIKGIASLTRDGRIVLTSPTVGANSVVAVEPGRVDQGKVDAAAILGFIGTSALDKPYPTGPAAIVCSGQQMGLRLVNLTNSPIELHLPSGSLLLPARGAMPLSARDTAHGPLQRLIDQGQVRLTAAP
jgi:hypothetical protein